MHSRLQKQLEIKPADKKNESKKPLEMAASPIKKLPSLDESKVEYCAFFNKTKHAEYDFLSNFYENPVISERHGKFKCSEGLYQYLKFAYLNDESLHKQFQGATGQEAWDLSRKLKDNIDPTWDRVSAMQESLHGKFSDDTLKRRLLGTGSAYLVENSPQGHDAYWSDNGDGSGQNQLGRLLMALRKELGGFGEVPRSAILDLFYSKKCTCCSNSCHFTNQGMFYNFCDSHMTHELRLGEFSMPIHLSDIPDGSGRFLYFQTNEIPGLVTEGAKLIAERIQSLELKNPYFVTPEASTIAIAHELRTKYKINGTIISKSKKPTDIDAFSISYSAITSKDKKKLYLSKLQADEMRDKDIVIIDNVCTTGETLRAVYQLLMHAGVPCDNIVESVVLFTEGEDVSSINISPKQSLKLHKFSHLPLFPSDPSVDKSRYRLYSAATIPTKHGLNTLAVFQDRTGSEDRDAIAYFHPDTFKKFGGENIPVRVHDACMTSELFESVKCDCKLQLDYAKDYLAEHGGMIIYLNQEGRGIGLGNKIAAYQLQQTQGLDTVMANRALGLPDDLRHYEAVRDILKTFGVKSIQLMTNNPRKVDCLRELGIQVVKTIPCLVDPQSEQMDFYMQSKAKQMGHMIPLHEQKQADDHEPGLGRKRRKVSSLFILPQPPTERSHIVAPIVKQKMG